MSLVARRLLSLVGILGFLALWQLVVGVTRPAPIRRTTLAFSTPRADRVSVVVLDDDGQIALERDLDLGAGRVAAAESLRVWLGAFQPSLAAWPPDGAGSALRVLLEGAQREFGSGLDRVDVAVPPGLAGGAEATGRARQLQHERSTRPSWIPDPFDAFRALAHMIGNGEIVRHAIASLFRVGAGFAIATLVGIPLGIALGSLAWLSSLTNAVIQCLRPISPIAWLPVATLLLGGGDVAAIFLIFLASFFPILVSTASAVGTVDLKYRRSALNFGIRGLAMARRLILPAVLPHILTSLRIALGISWVVVVAAEMLGVESGLGFLVLDARNQLRYDRVVAAILVIGVIGLGLDTTVRRIERDQLHRRGLEAR